ncbi:UDP-glucuronosyltransferase 3A2-like [Apodemus sylvaticus]|uniref:UDP-glucuronosyltransferase 3A2-like n=1 Tax=Apodemus sylvaticus TaxID=10129 RepID=UPI002242D72C|nr:UDP-glucuronosyltransferase 3A2-like [Apodemus sylvaticus]
MTGHQVLLLVNFCLYGFLLPEAAKILTISTMGGSHYFMIDSISQIFQDHGHQVTSLVPKTAFIQEKEKPYRVIYWFPPKDQLRKLGKRFELYITEAFNGREEFYSYAKLFEQYATLCSELLSRRDIMDSLIHENFDLLFLDSTDPCVFLIAEKLGKQFVSFLPTLFSFMDFGLPSPLSYVPVYGSSLTDQMDFWGRVKNFLMFFDFSRKQRKIFSYYDGTIQKHFAEGSRPVLSDLLLKAELWFVNCDFALDFARPLFPNTVYVGGLLDKPVQPIHQDLENFIAKFGDSGFVLVSQGSILSFYQTKKSIKEMNSAFAHLPQGVIWKFNASYWPKDIKLAKNVKIMDWLPQNDLLAHPSIRLFITHGGIRSVTEAIQHGVPIVGIPINLDQPYNMVRVEARKFGISIQPEDVKEETLVLKIKQVMEDKRYKSAAMAARVIRHTHPVPPAQRLVGWIDHILETGGAAHLKPYAFQQSWHEQYLLDVILFLVAFTLGILWLCAKVLGAVIRYLSKAKKMKKT